MVRKNSGFSPRTSTDRGFYSATGGMLMGSAAVDYTLPTQTTTGVVRPTGDVMGSSPPPPSNPVGTMTDNNAGTSVGVNPMSTVIPCPSLIVTDTNAGTTAGVNPNEPQVPGLSNSLAPSNMAPKIIGGLLIIAVLGYVAKKTLFKNKAKA
jgi:hypothetical protein